MDIIVRSFAREDYAQWQTLWHAYLAFAGTTLPAAVSEHTWQRLLEHTAMHGLGAYDPAGSMLGFAHIILHPNTWNIGECAYLEDLFVVPEARGLGAGKALLRALAKRCVAQGLARLEWSVLDWNAPSIAFYDSLGAEALNEWITRRMTGEPLKALAAG